LSHPQCIMSEIKPKAECKPVLAYGIQRATPELNSISEAGRSNA
jgi:hypothetical protein